MTSTPLTTQPAVLTIAGSDSSGGAGIQADLKTFAAHGCYGTSAITALTAQNTTGVQDVLPSPPEFVQKQVTSVLSDINIQAIKTGMLFDANNTRAAISALKVHFFSKPSDVTQNIPPLVCDPVCVSTSGHTLLDSSAIDVIIKELFPIATLITPNKAEAELILSHRQSSPATSKPLRSIENLEGMLLAAEALLRSGPKAVLLKGGHLTVSPEDVRIAAADHPDLQVVRDEITPHGDNMEILQTSTTAGMQLVVDILHETSDDGQLRTTIFCRPRIESTSTHGTGCTLSAAIAAELALGSNLTKAVRRAVQYTYLGILTANPAIGHGHGPLNHFHSMGAVLVPKITPTNPYPLTTLLIRRSASVWKAYVEHDFVKLLGKGTLPEKHFLHFIKQDYLYLKYYARAYALLAAKSHSFPAIDSATQIVLSVLREINTHTTFCASFGITEDELRRTPESPATAAYGGYLIDVGLKGDTTLLMMALLACLLGYGEVGLWLKKNVKTGDDGWVIMQGNPYLRWIEDYTGERYQHAVKLGLETIEARAAADPPSPNRFAEWYAVWERCTELEKGFWDMAMNLS
ncbi:Phosphomethylpyrimidine kinase-domain-containing protein [Lentinula aciculospora]|uniref:Phosphomethylpyrimidine kinase-domain-containing protein n=1 Tax=Lentinula aciculospora TaxID=153920 RepID=A0A9W9A6H1_9AGAR|nr:Phosphomethylpyrimidine kinase-domain-containing protein [Lentinula aciculospora]